jgi:hypothetical protein
VRLRAGFQAWPIEPKGAGCGAPIFLEAENVESNGPGETDDLNVKPIVIATFSRGELSQTITRQGRFKRRFCQGCEGMVQRYDLTTVR